MKKKINLDPKRDDDFGVYLAQLHANDAKVPADQPKGNTYRDQSKRLIEEQKKKKANKK